VTGLKLPERAEKREIRLGSKILFYSPDFLH